MTDAVPTPPTFLARPDGLRLACRFRPGKGPAIVFLPGYRSDMLGGKAVMLDDWAAAHGRTMLRFDYAGCGESEGRFVDGTLASWRDDAQRAIDAFLPEGPLILVGSSMGGWIALLLARDLGARVAGLVGIAAAPDFTSWGYSEAEKETLRRAGELNPDQPFGSPPHTTLAFWQSGESLKLLGGLIPVDCPARLIQGQRDDVVPWKLAHQIAGRIRSADVQTILVKDGDHRLSRPQDLSLLAATVAALTQE